MAAGMREREYDAVVVGVVPASGTVRAAIGRHPRDRTKMTVLANGRPAVSHYRVLERFTQHTHLRVKLETGRTHQIRVHMTHLRHPVVGDPVYGGRAHRGAGLPEALRQQLANFPRQALHARELEFEHPVTGARIQVTAELPADMQALLAALRAQTLACEQFEVVVVEDGASPATSAALEAERKRGELSLRVVRHGMPRGPGAARNTAWRAAHAPLIAFTDDDCIPASGWLEAGLTAAREQPGAVLQGRTQPNAAELDWDGIFSRTLQVDRLGPHYETCNIFYPRALLERLGGFDEGFGLAPGGEDTDLAWRAIGAGAQTVFAPDALVHHAVERIGPLGMLRLASRWTETIRIFAAHPALREQALVRRVFWNVWHYLLLRTALALLLPRPLRRFLVARHALELRRRARRAGAGAWALPFLLAYDLVETWAVLRGAVRYRTLVI
jgi:GT2 family glycosyltransferase